MLSVWRLCAARHARTAFSGEGAARFGGRWNDRGDRLVYTATSLSLAVVEILVHVDEVPRNFIAIRADIPSGVKVEQLRVASLPRGWRSFPAPAQLGVIGTRWAQAGRALALRVPSAVIPQEYNVLINPVHPDMRKVFIHKPERFSFDLRLKPIR
jgi:RES domain-containing protein